MKRIFLNALSIVLVLFAVPQTGNAQVWLAKNADFEFFSQASLEDIEAKSKKGVIALNIETGKVFGKISIKSFKFDNSLMKEHFNENYMESGKYPNAIFDGIIENLPDLNNPGEYDLILDGSFTIHGVKKKMPLNIHLHVKKDKIIGTSSFKIKCEDFNIKIPKLVIKNIAEEIEVKIKSEFNPYKK